MRLALSLCLCVFAAEVSAADPPTPANLRGVAREVVWKKEGGDSVLRGVSVSDSPVRDADLEALKKHPTLRGVDLQLLQITGKGLAHVAALGQLERLTVYKCFDLKDADFVVLKKLTRLRSLNLSATAVGDEGLKAVAGLADLEYLNIGHTKATAAGLRELKRLKKLKVLVVFGYPREVMEAAQAELKAANPGLKFGDVLHMPDPTFRR